MQIYTLRNSIEQPSRETGIPLTSSVPFIDLGGNILAV